MAWYDYKTVSQMEQGQDKRFAELSPPAQEGFFQKLIDPKYLPFIMGASVFLAIGVLVTKKKRKRK